MGILGRFFYVDFGAEEPDKSRTCLLHDLFKQNPTEFARKTNTELAKDLKFLEEHLALYRKKLAFVQAILKSPNQDKVEELSSFLGKIKGIIEQEFDEEKKEKKYTMKILKSLEKAILKEQPDALHEDEISLHAELRALREEIKNLEPHLRAQLDFSDMNTPEQLKNLPWLFEEIKQEGQILGLEKDTLKKLNDDMNRFEVDIVIGP